MHLVRPGHTRRVLHIERRPVVVAFTDADYGAIGEDPTVVVVVGDWKLSAALSEFLVQIEYLVFCIDLFYATATTASQLPQSLGDLFCRETVFAVSFIVTVIELCVTVAAGNCLYGWSAMAPIRRN
ncbi:hypothetical protein BN970_01531 [Mycolicibacterium conceptionense]|uniref:Uncharacterized protein n=1 Tax=Mycolicibacterium conceptionense TaxID=451644 RepID=A0A0U1D4E8_9MYCO|nr:hypothetical protein AWB98_02005 [Mycolicibacterium conceptionense]CQD07948.1 hypothetical protein BN970_01531 [Mycolicibacterium conceptionense]